MLKLADWVQNKWQVMALNNEHNRDKNKPMIEEPTPSPFYDIDIEGMKPPKLKDYVSLNSCKNNNELIKKT